MASKMAVQARPSMMNYLNEHRSSNMASKMAVQAHPSMMNYLNEHRSSSMASKMAVIIIITING